MKIFAVLSLLIALLVGQPSHADEVNALIQQCQHLAHLDVASIKNLQMQNPPDDIFKDESFGRAYLHALHNDSIKTQRSVMSYNQDSPNKAGILFAGIVRHDLPMVKAAYSASSVAYFASKDVLPPMTMAASCGFSEGVFFFLGQGIDPNAGHDLGAFNAALAVDDYAVARGLLKAGYKIEADEKRCYSSHRILQRNEVSVPADLKAAIKGQSCASK